MLELTPVPLQCLNIGKSPGACKLFWGTINGYGNITFTNINADDQTRNTIQNFDNSKINAYISKTTSYVSKLVLACAAKNTSESMLISSKNTNKETPCMFLKSTFLCNDTSLNRGMAKM